jgi:hypothetical protein
MARVVKFVSSSGHADAMGLSFLGIGISDLAIFGDLGLADKNVVPVPSIHSAVGRLAPMPSGRAGPICCQGFVPRGCGRVQGGASEGSLVFRQRVDWWRARQCGGHTVKWWLLGQRGGRRDGLRGWGVGNLGQADRVGRVVGAFVTSASVGRYWAWVGVGGGCGWKRPRFWCRGCDGWNHPRLWCRGCDDRVNHSRFWYRGMRGCGRWRRGPL